MKVNPLEYDKVIVKYAMLTDEHRFLVSASIDRLIKIQRETEKNTPRRGRTGGRLI